MGEAQRWVHFIGAVVLGRGTWNYPSDLKGAKCRNQFQVAWPAFTCLWFWKLCAWPWAWLLVREQSPHILPRTGDTPAPKPTSNCPCLSCPKHTQNANIRWFPEGRSSVSSLNSSDRPIWVIYFYFLKNLDFEISSAHLLKIHTNPISFFTTIFRMY